MKIKFFFNENLSNFGKLNFFPPLEFNTSILKSIQWPTFTSWIQYQYWKIHVKMGHSNTCKVGTKWVTVMCDPHKSSRTVTVQIRSIKYTDVKSHVCCSQLSLTLCQIVLIQFITETIESESSREKLYFIISSVKGFLIGGAHVLFLTHK